MHRMLPVYLPALPHLLAVFATAATAAIAAAAAASFTFAASGAAADSHHTAGHCTTALPPCCCWRAVRAPCGLTPSNSVHRASSASDSSYCARREVFFSRTKQDTCDYVKLLQDVILICTTSSLDHSLIKISSHAARAACLVGTANTIL